MRTLLMFCYFLLLIIGTSCGETSNKKSTNANDNIGTSDSLQSTTAKDKVILCFGNSLTAGMGLNIEEAFPAVIQNRLDSLGLPYQVVNAGLSGETTASGKNRVSWVLNQKVDIFILELGANDGLRGIPLSETRNNLQAIIDIVREKNSDAQIVLAGMQMPPNLGADYTAEFKNIFPDLAKKNQLKLIPFLLENVAGIPELNQQDRIHPTVEGQKIVAENVWLILKDLL
ncbi:MAG TPA: arylesterase [Flavobacteriaceae bacterium]